MISNPLKGEITVNSGDVSYVLRYTANSLCALEDALNKNISEIGVMLNDTSKLRISTMRTLFWAGLVDHQPQITEKMAGDIMTAVGIQTALIKVMEAFVAAFPQEKSTAENPTRARRAGTGRS